MLPPLSKEENWGLESLQMPPPQKKIILLRLWHFLKQKFPQLNPEKVVGHGGLAGQIHAIQNKFVQEFRNGSCQLLVCTSVLEEGIDVQECNLVIRKSSNSCHIIYNI